MGIFGHGWEIIVIAVVALLIFGPKRLPEMGSAVGKSIKEFKKGMAELTSGKDEEKNEDVRPSVSATYSELEREIASKKAASEAEAAREEVHSTDTRAE